jgi:hypothetical protein
MTFFGIGHIRLNPRTVKHAKINTVSHPQVIFQHRIKPDNRNALINILVSSSWIHVLTNSINASTLVTDLSVATIWQSLCFK